MNSSRKGMGKASQFFLVLLSFGFFIATYNLVTLVIHNLNQESAAGELMGARTREMRDGGETKRQPPAAAGGPRRSFHVALTATDAPYSKWQCRIMYYWYGKMKEAEESEMGGFTRVLHSGRPDELMGEIPTFVVDPLPSGMDRVRFAHS